MSGSTALSSIEHHLGGSMTKNRAEVRKKQFYKLQIRC
jgi:hypothetical protein